MIELTLLTIAALVLLSLVRPGKTPPLANPLIIERPGRYRMTLAPQLNLAQPFIEEIVKQLDIPASSGQNSATLCFEVRDKEVNAHGKDLYLLTVTQHKGMLYFQAATPQDGQTTDVATLRALATAALIGIEETEGDARWPEHIRAAIHAAARMRGSNVLEL